MPACCRRRACSSGLGPWPRFCLIGHFPSHTAWSRSLRAEWRLLPSLALPHALLPDARAGSPARTKNPTLPGTALFARAIPKPERPHQPETAQTLPPRGARTHHSRRGPPCRRGLRRRRSLRDWFPGNPSALSSSALAAAFGFESARLPWRRTDIIRRALHKSFPFPTDKGATLPQLRKHTDPTTSSASRSIAIPATTHASTAVNITAKTLSVHPIYPVFLLGYP